MRQPAYIRLLETITLSLMKHYRTSEHDQIPNAEDEGYFIAYNIAETIRRERQERGEAGPTGSRQGDTIALSLAARADKLLEQELQRREHVDREAATLGRESDRLLDAAVGLLQEIDFAQLINATRTTRKSNAALLSRLRPDSAGGDASEQCLDRSGIFFSLGQKTVALITGWHYNAVNALQFCVFTVEGDGKEKGVAYFSADDLTEAVEHFLRLVFQECATKSIAAYRETLQPLVATRDGNT